MARPRKKIDEALLEKLAQIQCSMTEMAAIMDCHVDTLRDRYSKIITKGREQGRMSLRRKQMEVALGGNATMLIWLGKNLLGQKDKSDEEIEALNNIADKYKNISNIDIEAIALGKS